MKEFPEPTKRRLVLLARLLAHYGEKTITSQQIQEFGLCTAAVARRDISLLELNCGDTKGWDAAELREALVHALNLDEKNRCCIVGLGRLGQVLLENKELQSSNFDLVAGFDSSVNRTEVLHSNFPLHTTNNLERIIREEGISYAILSTSADEAQTMTDKLCASGIKGIVNYTSCVLSVPEGVKVENAFPLTCLELLHAAVSKGSKNE